MERFHHPVGSRVIVIKDYDDAHEGMAGTVLIQNIDKGWEEGLQGIMFDEKFDGGHDLDGNCEYGYGQWVPPENLDSLDGDETSISCDEEVRFY